MGGLQFVAGGGSCRDNRSTGSFPRVLNIFVFFVDGDGITSSVSKAHRARRRKHTSIASDRVAVMDWRDFAPLESDSWPVTSASLPLMALLPLLMLPGCASRATLPYLLSALPWGCGGLESQYAIAGLVLGAYTGHEAFWRVP